MGHLEKRPSDRVGQPAVLYAHAMMAPPQPSELGLAEQLSVGTRQDAVTGVQAP
jgi:hypothetical protein